VRSLIADLGDAYCESLRRTAIGEFDVADADPERVIGLEQALSFLPAVPLSAEDAVRVRHGQRVAAGHAAVSVGEPVRLLGPGGLVAIGEADADGRLRPVVGLAG
jgi:tRNA pseudouridine55 synthase